MFRVKMAKMASVKNVAGKGMGIGAVMSDGSVVVAKSATHLMMLRRLTTKWVDNFNNPVTHDAMYQRLCKEVGYYV
jgi:hypothetical protein